MPFHTEGLLRLAVPQLAIDIPGTAGSMHTGDSNVDMLLYRWFGGRFIEENMGSFFPYFRLVPANMLLAIGLSALLGGAAAVIPAWRASQLRVVDAVRRVA